jgi:carbon-monoxide dehydrogenase large subunit
VTRTRDAVAAAALLVHPRFAGNLVFDIERGQRDQTEAALKSAAKVVALRLTNSRLAANPLEPRAYLADYNPGTDRYTVYATSQQPHYLRRWLSVYSLHIPEH